MNHRVLPSIFVNFWTNLALQDLFRLIIANKVSLLVSYYIMHDTDHNLATIHVIVGRLKGIEQQQRY